jgi:TFIIF-interacting CTD phosphatase-like protein
VKDLTLLGREMKDVIIIDNSPGAYSLQPENAIPILSWFDDYTDRELLHLIPILVKLSTVDDVRDYIRKFVKCDRVMMGRAWQLLKKRGKSEVEEKFIS